MDDVKQRFKRTRDKILRARSKEVVPFVTWRDIEERAQQAEIFFTGNSHVYKSMRQDLQEAENMVLTNRVKEVKQIKMVGDIQKIFSIDKETQMNELVGQIKYIRDTLSELQSWIDRKADMERREANGEILIQRELPDEQEDER